MPILGSSTRYYTVEVRSLTGYDVKLPSKAVIIHYVNTTQVMPSDEIDTDGTNYTGDAGAIWLVGEVFNDVANNFSITILYETSTGFVVKAKSGIVSTPSLTPMIPLTPSPMPPVRYGTYDERVL